MASIIQDLKTRTLYDAKLVNSKLYIITSSEKNKLISVYSNGKKYLTNKLVKLNLDDDIFIATRKNGYVSFTHYKVISLAKEKNCKLEFFWRICSENDINDIRKEEYRKFLRNFVSKVS